MKRWDAWKVEEIVSNSGPFKGIKRLLYSNNRYHVFVHRTAASEPGWPDRIHLSIRDNERSTRHDWRDFQRIKNELVGPLIEMVELYPSETAKVDLSNQYHLWGFDTTEPVFTGMGLGFNEGRKIWDGTSPRPEVPDADTSNAVQRPSEEESTL